MKKIDIEVGQKFGRLTVIEDLGCFIKDGTKKKSHYIRCLCDCGNKCIVNMSNLARGNTISCGCLRLNKLCNRLKKYNDYYVYGDTVFVKFSNCNEYFLCDLDDWEKLKDYTWSKNAQGYAVYSHKNSKIRFHRLVVDCDDNSIVDHIYPINGGVVDNRKSNLRVVGFSENSMNSKTPSNNTSGYKGVTLNKKANKWMAQIRYHGENIYLGIYSNIEDAVSVRREAEIKYFGEYRRCG